VNTSILALVGAGATFAAGLMYVAATLRGRVRPNRVTWFVGGLTGWIAFAGQVSQGVVLPAVLTLAVAIVPTLIVAASFVNREAYWRATRVDRVCLALAGAAVALLLLSTGDVAIAMGIAARGLSAVPTVVKSFRAPHTEPSTAYTAGMFGAVTTLATLDVWEFRTAGFAVYFLVYCSVMSFLVVVLPRLSRLSRHSQISQISQLSRPNAASCATRTPSVWAWIRWNPASRAQRCSGLSSSSALPERVAISALAAFTASTETSARSAVRSDTRSNSGTPVSSA
jgi:uncharacterized membrane protein YeaQ/YmgE (transglycosylase-associated protein family)